MRPLALFLAGFFLPLAACTVEQRNGQEVQLAPPLVAGNVWETTRQVTLPDGRVCTVSAGEMNVTQRSRNGTIMRQVATSYSLNPGDRYRVIIDGDVHETQEGWFNTSESEQIIHNLMTHDTVYTELQERVIDDSNEWKRANNKIRLDGFATQYKACERFVSSGRAPSQ
ncbi:MAG: hypothetical protein KGJ06_01550 [Pseudomonadota bacterium]|nr:hypothetical protein [Pseudomonadota bacterium]